MTTSSWGIRTAPSWIRATSLVLALAAFAGTVESVQAAGGIGEKPRQQPGPTVPGTATQPVAYPELHSVVLWLPQIKLNGPQPAQTPNAVPGGTEARGSVILTKATIGNAVITLASRNTSLLHVPASITVPSGASSVQFRYDPMPVAAPTTATVSASYRGQTKTASVTILPPQVQALTIDPAQLLGGQPTRGTVTLSGRGPSGSTFKVALTSNNPAAQVPAEVVLQGTAQQTQFQITTQAVGQQTPVLISASLAGTKRDATLTITPARLEQFGRRGWNGQTYVWVPSGECRPPGQAGLFSFDGRTALSGQLTGAAPQGGSVIQLTSSNGHVMTVPGPLTIAPNGTYAETQLTCPSVNTHTVVVISGSYLGETKTFTVNAYPLPQADLTVGAVTLYDAVGNVIQRPNNPQAFKLCAQVAQVPYVPYTSLRLVHKHSRGFSGQYDYELGGSSNSWQACRQMEGLEIGEYVDVTLTVDPLNKAAETNEGNNTRQVRVTR